MAKKTTRALSTKNLAWLKKLAAEIWEEHTDVNYANLSGRKFETKRYSEKRRLAPDEWTKLQQLIRRHELPCLPGGGTFGFGFSLTVCGHSPLPEAKPDTLIVVTGQHLPDILPGHQHWGEIWAAFEPFTHSPRNRELLEFYGFEAPRERGYYEY